MPRGLSSTQSSVEDLRTAPANGVCSKLTKVFGSMRSCKRVAPFAQTQSLFQSSMRCKVVVFSKESLRDHAALGDGRKDATGIHHRRHVKHITNYENVAVFVLITNVARL